MPRFNTGRVAVTEMTLEDGQTWDDEVTMTMTREQASVALAAVSIMLTNVTDGIEDAKVDARRGDAMALIVGPHLVQSAHDLTGVAAIITKECFPLLWAEVEAARQPRTEA